MSEPSAPTPSAQQPSELPALPDRLCVDPDSPFYNETVLSREIGIRFRGEEKTNVHEYCVSEGWVRVEVGNKVDRRGKPLTLELTGAVEPYHK
ncbi:MAG: DUF3297 family protein [Alphaproteobacteria bacterium]|nr:DUF3297 family protein [Alphaproteobacteria bacterium]